MKLVTNIVAVVDSGMRKQNQTIVFTFVFLLPDKILASFSQQESMKDQSYVNQ